MQIQNINEESFKKYGKILTGYHVDGILAEMEHTPLTREVIYVPSVEEMEALPDAEEMKNRGFGGLPIQIGYCNGDNRKLNGLEYHRSSEINIAVNNLVLLLGREQDIEADDTYDTSRVEAFFVPEIERLSPTNRCLHRHNEENHVTSRRAGCQCEGSH